MAPAATTGAGRLLRLALRRDRVLLTAWLTGIVALAAVVAGSVIGLVLVAVAAVAAQVAASARAANAATAGVIGMAFLLRAVGDAAGRVDETGTTVVSAWPSWLSPIGWGQQARAFGDERWWVLWPFAGTVIVLAAVAVFTVTRRDLGAGLVPARPGAARAGRWLASPVGLVWRLQRGVFVGWALAMTVVGAAFGAVGDSADELVGISEDLALALEGLADGSLVELYFAFAVGFLAIAASGFGVQAALRLRTEEFGGRTEAVLATAVSRRSCSRTSPRCLPRRGRGRRSWRCSRSPWC